MNNGQVFQLTNFHQKSNQLSMTKMKDAVYYWYYIVIRTAFLFFVYLARFAGFLSPSKYFPSEIEVFEKTIRPKFLKFADCENVNQYKKCNENVELIFYNRKDLTEIMKIQDNEIEKKWRTRILIQHTPRGNIVMFFDAYKGGFAYYCDHTVVPIRILNAVAMKYVMRYFCLDFFVDEISFKGNTSPLIPLLNKEDNEENEKIKKVLNKLAEKTNVDADKMPFLKPKMSAIIEKANAKPNPIEKSPLLPSKEKRINKFIYLGKINNFSIIQKKPIIHISPINMKIENMDEFKNVSWDEYKKKRHT